MVDASVQAQALAGPASTVASVGIVRHRAIRSEVSRIDWLDMVLICLFLIGMYTNYTIMVSEKVPFPSAPSGVAGLFLLWRRRDSITPRAFAGFIIVILLFLISIIYATDIRFLPRRFNGLSGELFIEKEITDVYLRSPFYSGHWQAASASTELVVNFFWLHWIFLGMVGGLIMMAALTLWLRVLGVPSFAFCWMVWAILGQAAGAYVGPSCWAVLFLAGAAAVFNQQPPKDLRGRGTTKHLLRRRPYRNYAAQAGASHSQPA